jgi:hypothetical protein
MTRIHFKVILQLHSVCVVTKYLKKYFRGKNKCFVNPKNIFIKLEMYFFFSYSTLMYLHIPTYVTTFIIETLERKSN